MQRLAEPHSKDCWIKGTLDGACFKGKDVPKAQMYRCSLIDFSGQMFTFTSASVNQAKVFSKTVRRFSTVHFPGFNNFVLDFKNINIVS